MDIKANADDPTIELKNGPGDIIFNVNHAEILRLCENGDIKRNGKTIESDKEIVIALREFIFHIRC